MNAIQEAIAHLKMICMESDAEVPCKGTDCQDCSIQMAIDALEQKEGDEDANRKEVTSEVDRN